MSVSLLDLPTDATQPMILGLTPTTESEWRRDTDLLYLTRVSDAYIGQLLIAAELLPGDGLSEAGADQRLTRAGKLLLADIQRQRRLQILAVRR